MVNDASAWMLPCHEGLELSWRTLTITSEILNETQNFMDAQHSAAGQPGIDFLSLSKNGQSPFLDACSV
jgi:hypothetical protein